METYIILFIIAFFILYSFLVWVFEKIDIIYIRKKSIRNKIHKTWDELYAHYKKKEETLQQEYKIRFDGVDNTIRIRKDELEHYYRNIYESRTNELIRTKENEIQSLLQQKHELEGIIDSKNNKIEELKQTIYGVSPFSKVAAMIADYRCAWFDNTINYLVSRTRPAYRAAEIVTEVKKKYRELLFVYKQMQYKYDFLLSVFPELRTYIDDEEALLHLTEYENYNTFDNDRDRAHDWLSDEEFNTLSITERNQLALDRYNQRNRTNWEIGIEYELFVGHKFREKGFEVTQFGEINGVEDLGRDLIAVKGNTTYIVQCKRWADNRQLHENVICQLFGTSIEYKINNNLPDSVLVYPLLCSTAGLSDTAMEFAKRLDVCVRILPMGEYPMIKCNINSSGEKIYHLPFDQQYHRTLINSPGEFYAYTVAEAEAQGFRRAFRHFAN